MTAYEMHEPDYTGTTTEDWEAPQLEDFDTDDLSTVADHFVLSASGFPPENFTDLKAPSSTPTETSTRTRYRRPTAGPTASRRSTTSTRTPSPT